MTTDADSHLVKYAADLAAVAVLPEKTANSFMDALKDPAVQRYLGYGLGGAGLGALLGYLQRGDKKKRNALSYGLMGGMGGLGLAALAGGMNWQNPNFNGANTGGQDKLKSLGTAMATPTKDLPRFKSTPGVKNAPLNAAGHTAQTLVDAGLLPKNQSPATTAAGGAAGLTAGMLVNRTGAPQAAAKTINNAITAARNSRVNAALTGRLKHRERLLNNAINPITSNTTNSGRGIPSNKEFRYWSGYGSPGGKGRTSVRPGGVMNPTNAAGRFKQRYSVPAGGGKFGRTVKTLAPAAAPIVFSLLGANAPSLLTE